jgi:hypothetical protein
MKKRQATLQEKVQVNLREIKTNDQSLEGLETYQKTDESDDKVLR